ncbi:type II secretion system F family protein [Brachybacterium nesterenkovii]|uniref:Flp pilus assembly protein TadB n=1 Tax=Brachybacterium nesterenkovii TaxID=47847 RepID=A0A1X6WYH9_9MICO|nr:type II secretion system F family protein [Brachybacterium nesterenkovii]SLM90950.1 Flp pilus assembly protein TadB [Brachybacterium nesterenkovii]
MRAGALLGLVLGIGLLAIWVSMWEVDGAPRRRVSSSGPILRIRDDLVQVGLGSVPAGAVPVVCAGVGLLTALLVQSVSGASVVALALGGILAVLPLAALRAAAHRRRVELREVWPETVDHIASAVRAGLSLPEALVQVGQRGPEALRAPFVEFARDYQASGDFGSGLDRLKARLADPVGDRIVEALRITRDVGGTDLGLLLRTLSAFLREDARTRSELEARQSWTVNASRLALAAPWIVLALMSTRPQAAQAYDSPTGLAVILGGAVVSVIAYRVMLRIARLPQDERVLR